MHPSYIRIIRGLLDGSVMVSEERIWEGDVPYYAWFLSSGKEARALSLLETLAIAVLEGDDAASSALQDLIAEGRDEALGKPLHEGDLLAAGMRKAGGVNYPLFKSERFFLTKTANGWRPVGTGTESPGSNLCSSKRLATSTLFSADSGDSRVIGNFPCEERSWSDDMIGIGLHVATCPSDIVARRAFADAAYEAGFEAFAQAAIAQSNQSPLSPTNIEAIRDFWSYNYPFVFSFKRFWETPHEVAFFDHGWPIFVVSGTSSSAAVFAASFSFHLSNFARPHGRRGWLVWAEHWLPRQKAWFQSAHRSQQEFVWDTLADEATNRRDALLEIGAALAHTIKESAGIFVDPDEELEPLRDLFDSYLYDTVWADRLEN